MEMREMWTQFGSSFAGLMFMWAMLEKFFPNYIRNYVGRLFNRLVVYFNPHIQISFHEYSADRLRRNEAYTAIEHYLCSKAMEQAAKLKGEVLKNTQPIVLSMDDHQEISDVYKGVKLLWVLDKTAQRQSISRDGDNGGKRYFKLTFHKFHRKMITKFYLNYVLEEGRDIEARKRQRKLYTNSPSYGGYGRGIWGHVVFDHPASFQTLAMDPEKKKEIIDDLVTFSKAKKYYARIGKAWKRGYLLYGPPGTGKSTMIAAIANYLNYDIYDLELMAVKDNTDLKKLLIETSTKSIIVIEDIDCSLDLTGQRKNEVKKKDGQVKDENNLIKNKEEEEEDREGGEKKNGNNVTLSGLLNFIDGLWSASSGERLIIFTTNYVEKLDSALIRRGRMDKHIELSYCKFEAFKVLAKNYLDLDSHPLFDRIGQLLEETNVTPADVAENLTPKTTKGDVETCLKSLIQAIEAAKEGEIVKTEEYAMLNVIRFR